jgi:hypothetical protein
VWQPDPIDTSDVRVPREVEDVLETLSRHAHDTWGAKRIADHWRYGPQRDDKLRHHPNLVGYDELTDHDKSYDRELITGTIRLLIKLGFSVERRAQPPADGENPGS